MISTPDNNSSDLFESLPLQEGTRSIRVLDVKKSISMAGQDPIQCELRVINLDSDGNNSFNALSYVWGVEWTGNYFISCGSSLFGVTRNCHSALNHLRAKLGEFTIWIDAICINQANEKEKTEQIRLMGDIYAEAEAVYVWLGDSDAATDRALTYLKTAGYMKDYFIDGDPEMPSLEKPRLGAAAWKLLASWLRHNNTFYPCSKQDPTNWASFYLTRLKNKLSGSTTLPSYRDVHHLLDNEWIKRMWTYQEILLASNPIVVCGTYHISWSRFAAGIVFLEYSGVNSLYKEPVLPNLREWANIALGRDYLQSSNSPQADPSLAGGDKLKLRGAGLREYQHFIIYAGAWVYWVAQLAAIIAGFCAFCASAGSVINVMLWSTDISGCVKAARMTAVPLRAISAAEMASSNAIECVKACASKNIATCASICADAAQAAANSAAQVSFHQHHTELYEKFNIKYGTACALLTVVLITFGVIFFITLRVPRPGLVSSNRGIKIDLVDGLYNRKSKESKDKVLALQAVLQRLSKADFEAIDHNLSVQLMFKQLCVQLMNATGTLSFLVPAAQHSLPGFSWVPDLTAEFDPFWLHPDIFTNKPADATRDSQGYWRLEPGNNNNLFIRGRQICTVRHLFDFSETSLAYNPSQVDLHIQNNLNLMKLLQRVTDPDHFITSILKQTNGSGEEQVIPESKFRSIARTLKNAVRVGSDRYVLESIRANISPDDSECSNLSACLKSQILVCNALAKTKKRFFTTTDIRWAVLDPHLGLVWETVSRTAIGVGNSDVQAGHHVVLIAGVSVPLIFARGPESTRLISPAVLNGVEFGELWHGDSEKDMEEFRLS